MKIAVSLAKELLLAADRTLQDYLRRRRHEKITEQLNRVYRDQPDLEDRPTLTKMKAKFEQTIHERW